jgi:hypothetical protein
MGEIRKPAAQRVIEGEPIQLDSIQNGRELIPLVRLTGRVRRRAFVGDERLSAQGWAVVHMRPVALLERDGDGERRIPIPNVTGQALGKMFLVALVIPVLAFVAVRLVGEKLITQKEEADGERN